MKTHEVRSWPDYFSGLRDGGRNCDVRFDDRNYAVGDLLRIREYDDKKGTYTGREVTRRITYILRGAGAGAIPPLAGIYPRYVVLSLGPAQ